MSYLKGSEWRKWDLHVHTPYSYLNNHFRNDFDEYAKQLFKKAMEKDITAIGITDYFTIEGYKKLKQEYIENKEKLKELFTEDEIEKIKQILVLPNIEFRLNKVIEIRKENGPVEAKRINFHVIFSNEVSIEDIEENFLKEIKFVYEGTPQSEDEKRSLKLHNLKALGERLKREHPEFSNKSDIEVGMMNAMVDDTDIIKILVNKKSIFEGKYLLFVPSDGDLSRIPWDSQAHNLRKVIIQKANGLFASNPNTIKWGLGKSYPTPEEFIKEFKSLKPCIWGSDAHDFDTLFEPDERRYTWIKADPTFEGLKQIIYEPEERVFIADEPELIKRVRENKTKFIKTLRIKQVEGYDEKSGRWFENIEIPFNSGLVAIIGNKGSGKSAIVDILGLCGDSHQYDDFSFLTKDRFLKGGLAKNFEGELEWESGEKIKKNLSDNVDKNAPERVRYLPQNYFEKLTNNLETYEFEKTLEKVVFSHLPEEEKLGKNSFEDLINYKKQSVSEERDLILEEIRKLNEAIIELEKKAHPNYKEKHQKELELKQKELEQHEKNKPKEVKNPKDDKTLSEEQKNLINELEKLNKDLEKAKKLTKQKEETKVILRKELEDLRNIKDELERYSKTIKGYMSQNIEKFRKYGFDISNIIKFEINFEAIDEKIEQKTFDFKGIEQSVKELKAKRESLHININNLKNKLSEQEKRFQQYLEEITRWKEKKYQIIGDEQTFDTVKWLEREIKFIEAELTDKLENLRKKRTTKTLQIYDKKNELVDFYGIFKDAVDNEISKYKGIIGDYEISIDASLKINPRFYDRFLNFINQKSRGSFHGKIEGEAMLKALLVKTGQNSKESIKIMLNEILRYLEYDQREQFNNVRRYITEQIKELKDFYDYVFSLEYLEPFYELKLGNKSLPQLSPGEKGAMLIVFYLMLDKGNISLIIDQPEENLDNESIYKILTHFIKLTKQKRQVIMVTHNPNLAIVGDAEQIIFVNIDKKNNTKFSFEVGSIENPVINKHASDILEGTLKAFNVRRLKYLNTQVLENR